MKNKRNTHVVPSSRLCAWLLTMLMLLQVSTMQAEDWMKRADKFSMESHTDHVTFKVFLCDLDRSNTYAKSGGVYATCNGESNKWILDLCYISEGSDENPFGKVRARYCIGESRAWFTNGYGQAEQKITFNSADYLLQKWGSDNHYLTTALDFYYPASMAGKTWTFYYQYDHNDGGTYTMKLGSAYLSPEMGLKHFNLADHKCERTGIDQLRFTVPPLPDDVDSKLSEIHIHEGVYNVKFTYTKQDGSVVQQSETFNCVKKDNKAYTVDIPEEVGNPKKISMYVVGKDGLKDSRNYYWKDEREYNYYDIFPSVPNPGSITAEYRQFDDAAMLSWVHPSGNYMECTPYIYRLETDASGKALSGKTWSKRGTIGKANEGSLSYLDNGLDMGSNYKYMVVNVPKAYIDNGITSSSLNNPDDKLLNKLGYRVSDVLYTGPTMNIHSLRQDTTVTDKVKLTWQYSRVPTDASSVNFQVLRKVSENSDWSEHGNVSGDAQPAAGYSLSYEDNTLPNMSTRYQYKIRVSVANDKFHFESDPITAGLLSGSRVKTFVATKGTHDATVRLSWTAKQVGTDNTTYVISRRYVNSGSDYMQIYSTNGSAELYTYEDNTVQPGYYYEYKIDAYNGSVQQNSLYDVGFCQARGVISGRVTFGTGSAVEDVRLTLTASDSGDDNTVKGASQYVDGASTGIAWNADSKETEKVFGSDKDFTVQMFVRPDEGLNEGAVIANIPHVGQIAVGSQTDQSYDLVHVVDIGHEVDLSTLTGNYVAQDKDILIGKLNDNYKISIAEGATVVLKDVTITGVNQYQYRWAGITCQGDATIYLEGSNTVRGFYDEYPGIFVNKDQTLTIKGNGRLRASSNGYATGIGSAYSIDGGNIIIDGGEIVSTGGSQSPGIGASRNSDCGFITITDNVSMVTAEGDNAKMSIGLGQNGTHCGVITIGGVVYWDGSSYQNGGDDTSTGLTRTPYIYVGNGTGGEASMRKITSTGVSLPANVYSLLSVSKTGSQFNIQAGDGEQKTLNAATELTGTFSIGGALGVNANKAFHGNFTEVRVWDHKLTEKEQSNYSDRVLNGRETGLKLYWPMDEGLDRYVFDASYANDLPNGRHATVGSNISTSSIIPTAGQLSRYSMTNENGEYIIRGIPFVGSGSTYTVRPALSIHEFSPISRNGFIGNGNLTLNSYDFTDVSSFPVHGKITYLDTNIPVDSIQFKIDGNLVQTKDGMVMTDANGEYTLSVPIGNHLIEPYKNGHRLTSFPLDGSTYDFKRAEVINFVDSTLVNITGRINGGYSDQDEPVGFRRSVNRLGKATIKLSLGKDSQCSFNYIVDEHGDGSFGTVDIPVESAIETIKSTSYRAGGSHDDTYYIYITTDEETGEFSALLPPLKYKVESIKFDGGTDYDNEPVFAQNLPLINAINTDTEKMPEDSLVMDNAVYKYKYSAKMVRQYRANPSIKVVQRGMKNGAFGELKVPATTLANLTDTIEVLKYTDNAYEYLFGLPIFCQGERYDFDIYVAEEYKNLDTGETIKEIPKDGVVSIMNDASILTRVLAEKAIIDGQEVEAGTEWESPNILIAINDEGKASYEFEGGWPNLAEGHLRNLSIGVNIDGRTTMWKAPNSQTEALDLILLGSLPSGTNFMTEGPDKVAYIIRRPPGSSSSAFLENTKINTYGSSTTTIHDKNFGGGAYVSTAPSWEVYIGTGSGFISIMEHSHLFVVANTTNTRVDGHKDSDYKAEENSFTLSEKIATPNSMLYSLTHNDYRAESGDTYIGQSTNLTFSKARLLGFYQQSNGTYKLDQKEGVAVGESFSTQFSYTQEYIEDYLIPNWWSLIKDRLIYVEGNHWDKNSLPVVAGEVRYYTSYKPTDPEYGHSNGDLEFWGDKYEERGGYPSYSIVDGTGEGAIDEVGNAINQIISWQAKIRQNEADKLEAFNDSKALEQNYSISGGTSYTQTTQNSFKHSTSVKDEAYYTINDDLKVGLLFNNLGAYGIMTWYNHHNDVDVVDTVTVSNNTVSWTLSDSDPRTALSVDVYKSPAGWGPIFRTRGGQTVNPYEGATTTNFEKPGTALNAATMRIENPQLKVLGAAEQTDVPAGGEAKFILQLKNNSETQSICNYILTVLDGSNPNGAILKMDGQALSLGFNGRSFVMKGDETIEKTLVVTQSDRSIVDYNDIKLVLRSEKDVSTMSDVVNLRVHFVPASAHVDLKVDHTILNQEYMKENNGVIATMHNLDRQDEGLRGVRLRYRLKGTDSWNLIKQWSINPEDWTHDYLEMPSGSSFTYPVSFFQDGTYELQAQSFGKYGNDDVTYESEIVEVTQDTRGPKVLGMLDPLNGQLTYLNRNNMHLRFNEVLNSNALSKSDNFRIVGGMNNAASGDQYPDVALQLNGDKVETDATILLRNTDLAFDMWFYRQSDGTIISMGTENNLLSLSTHDNGMLRARVGTEEEEYETGVQLPAEKWTYMALSYKRKTESDPENRITMLYVDADMKSPQYIGQNVPAKEFLGNGKLSIGGDGMVGMVSMLSIWNTSISAEDLYVSRNETRAAYTPGLVGYWTMDEGHGKVAHDIARSRHMQLPAESWYINNENRAVHINGEEPLKINTSTFAPRPTDNFALEFWFRGDKTVEANKNARLLSVLNGMTIGFNEGKLIIGRNSHTIGDDNMEVIGMDGEIELSATNYVDNQWHHFALNVRRGASAIIYIDGQPIKTLPESNFSGVSAHLMFVGGEETLLDAQGTNAGGITNLFTGDFDEIRIWSAALDGQLIGERMYERLDDSYNGLVGYFPMEEIHRMQNGKVTTDFSLQNFGITTSQVSMEGNVTQSLNAPPLLPGSSRMRLEDVEFDFTASNDEIYFSFPDSSLPLMDGNDFILTIQNIKDEHGNNSETTEWMFHADFAALDWGVWDSSSKAISVTKHWDEQMELVLELVNKTGQSQTYEITGMPSWITVDSPVGIIEGDQKYITFTIKPTVSIGKRTEYIYVTDRLGIKRVLQIELEVLGDEPDWTVDTERYESNMMLTGQVYIDDKISEFTTTKIAAFDDMGNCRGFAYPEYVSSRDAFYVNMIIYGGSATDISSGERSLKLKMYDGSTGKTYPIVKIFTPDGTVSTTLTYSPDAVIGSYDKPVIFRSTDDIEQTLQLPLGWSWMSIYVNPESTAIADVLPQNPKELKKYRNIKGRFAFASAKSDGSAIVGELDEITPGNMYKIQTSAATTLEVFGEPISVLRTAQEIHPGYNWIGSLSSSVLSPEDAFADLAPEKDDMVKNRTSMATYNGKGTWEGTLKNIVPGQGYIYLSKASQTKTFHYPFVLTTPDTPTPAPRMDATSTVHYTPVDPYLYPDNMNFIATIEKDGNNVDNAELAAFIEGECRGAVAYNNGYYFLTIMGSAQDDANIPIQLRAYSDGQEYILDESKTFISDAVYGTLDNPYVLTLSTTGIRDVYVDDENDTEWYTLQGFKIGRRPTAAGVYIHNGKKVTIRRNSKGNMK